MPRIKGTDRNDRLRGTDRPDTLQGGAGNDTIAGRDGYNWLYGQDGNDRLVGGGDTDEMIGGDGVDVMDGGDGQDAVRYDDEDGGAPVVVRLARGEARDTYGNTDRLTNVEVACGTAGADTLSGGNRANDSYEGFLGFAGADVIDGGRGFDEVRYDLDHTYDGNRGIVANLARGTIRDGFGDVDRVKSIEGVRGTEFRDRIVGSRDTNDLFGLGGNDTIDGGRGNDWITGGYGKDNITLGAGRDVLFLHDRDVDVIRDFKPGEDRLGLREGTTFIEADDPDVSVSGRQPAAIYLAERGTLYYDADGRGNGDAVLIARFNGRPDITADDVLYG